MTTPNETPDPFMTPATHASPGYQGNVPPAPMAPPGYPQVPPGYAQGAPGGYAPIHVAPDVPRKLALWTIVLTGAYTATTLISAALSPQTLDKIKASIEDPDSATPFGTTNPGDALALPAMIASYVLLALWMSRIRSARKARGEVVGGPPAVEWWGWFIPFANWVLPFLGMRAITKGRVSTGVLLGWWLPYVLAGMLSGAAASLSFAAIDWSTGEMTKPEALDPMVGLSWASAGILVVSWVFLTMVIRTTTRREAGEA